jgi:hypothetical protein
VPNDTPGGAISTRSGRSATGQVCHWLPSPGAGLRKGLRRRALADVDFPAGGVSAAMGGDVDVVPLRELRWAPRRFA